MGCIVIKLYTENSLMWEGWKWDTWYSGREYNPSTKSGWNVDRDHARETTTTIDHYASNYFRRRINLWVAIFDGSARVKGNCGACSAIVWILPDWKVVTAASRFVTGLTVNKLEYRGLFLCFNLLTNQTRGRVIICEIIIKWSGKGVGRSIVKLQIYNCWDIKRCRNSHHGPNIFFYMWNAIGMQAQIDWQVKLCRKLKVG